MIPLASGAVSSWHCLVPASWSPSCTRSSGIARLPPPRKVFVNRSRRERRARNALLSLFLAGASGKRLLRRIVLTRLSAGHGSGENLLAARARVIPERMDIEVVRGHALVITNKLQARFIDGRI